MKYKLIDLDNKESYGINFLNKVGLFQFDGTVFCFLGMISSKVIQITIYENTMIVQTKKSTYEFEKEK